MTQRDYVKFATVIKEEMERPMTQNGGIQTAYVMGRRNGVEELARRIAEICRADNERFDSDQFLKAAGIE